MQIIKRIIFTSSYLLLARNFLPPSTSFATEFNTNTGNQACNIPFAVPSRDFNSNKLFENNEMDDSYCPGSTSAAFVTTPDEKSAKKLAHAIIAQKLAACVNIISQIQSIYMWEGKVNEDNEYLLMIKTRSSRINELSKYVRENHPYSVAEVISLPIENGNLPYLNWITQTVPEKK